MKYNGFTLVELLVTMTIIVIMAVIAIPNFNKHQRLIELQNKSDEVNAGLDEMHVKAMNPEKGTTRYYANIIETVSLLSGQIIFGSYDNTTSTKTDYKTIDILNNQTFDYVVDGSKVRYLVCDNGKNYCCDVANVGDACITPIDGPSATDFFQLTSNDLLKTVHFKVFSNPFRVTSVTTP